MTKLEMFAQKTGLELVAYSSVWNFHSLPHLTQALENKKSNLYAAREALKKEGFTGGFTIIVGKIGRTAHSETEIGIFKGLVNNDNYDLYYTKGCDEFFI